MFVTLIRKEVKEPMAPEARVFRPKNEDENNLIDRLMDVHKAEGHIVRPSWTQYVSFLINRDLKEVVDRHKLRTGGI